MNCCTKCGTPWNEHGTGCTPHQGTVGFAPSPVAPLVMLTLRLADGREVTLGRSPQTLLDDEIERTVYALIRDWLRAVRNAGVPVA